MIRLKNIAINDNIIKCDIFPEDSKENGTLEIDMRKTVVSFSLPKGYEWCKNHIEHAKKHLSNIYVSKKIPEEKIIMWH
jgi:hypothetical protein